MVRHANHEWQMLGSQSSTFTYVEIRKEEDVVELVLSLPKFGKRGSLKKQRHMFGIEIGGCWTAIC